MTNHLSYGTAHSLFYIEWKAVKYTIYDMETVNTCVTLSAIFNLDLQTDNGLRFRNIGNGVLYKIFET
jgi:hypothetical protein